MIGRIRWLLLCGLVITTAPACESLGINSPEDPPDAPVVLPVQYRGQQTQVWCWAATSEMVLAYHGVYVSQCQILSAWMQTDCCVPNPMCEAGASLPVIQGTLSHFGGLGSYIAGALSYDQVRSEIDAGRPMIVAYSGSFTGHVVVIYGYDPTLGTVLIHDPYFGSFNVQYGNSFNYGGTMYWYQTIVGIGR